MRWQFLIIIVPVVLLVMFGKNPYKEEQERWRKYGDDPLVATINMHNEQRDKEAAGWFGMGGAAIEQPKSNRPSPDLMDPDLSGLHVDDGVKTGGVTSVESGDYYPPIAKSTPEQPPVDVTKTSPATSLRSGQRIWFNDMAVYTVDAAGKTISLPDGDYTLIDGSNMTVQGGKRVSN